MNRFERSRALDRARREDLLEEVQRRLRGSGLLSGLQPADRDDVVQEAMLAFYQYPSSVRNDWELLTGILKHKLKDHYRKQRRLPASIETMELVVGRAKEQRETDLAEILAPVRTFAGRAERANKPRVADCLKRVAAGTPYAKAVAQTAARYAMRPEAVRLAVNRFLVRHDIRGGVRGLIPSSPSNSSTDGNSTWR